MVSVVKAWGHKRGLLMVNVELGREGEGVVLRCLDIPTPSD